MNVIDEPYNGSKGPCAILDLRMNYDSEVFRLLRDFNISYNIHLPGDSQRKIRPFSTVDLQFRMADYSLVKSWLAVVR